MKSIRRMPYLPLPILAFLLFLFLFLSGCGNHAQVHVYDRNISQTELSCLRLRVFPPNPSIEKSMLHLYSFRNSCPYTLEISYENGIRCNSNANAARKTLENFPSTYLRMELRRGMTLLYSYYIDLTHPVDEDDLRQGFSRLRSDLRLKQ